MSALLFGDPCPHPWESLLLVPHANAARCRGCGLDFELDPKTMARAIEAMRRHYDGLSYRGTVEPLARSHVPSDVGG